MVNFRSGIIQTLINSGIRVIIAAPHDDYVDALKALGAEYVEWHLVGRSTRISSEISAIRQLRSIYRRMRPDIAFHFTIKPIIYGALVCRSLGIPFVSVVTGLGYVFINNNLVSRISKLLYRATLRWSMEVWLLNDDDRETMTTQGLLNGTNVRILPGEGVNTSFFSLEKFPTTTRPQFLFLARLLRDKGVFEYVDAARSLLQAGIDAEFALLGAVDSDNPTSISSEMVRAWESEGVVKYLGICKDVRPYITTAHCIVLPSYREGVPRSLLEASSMGRPVIATDVPGCRDVVIDGETGFLCASRNYIALAAAIKKFLLLTDADQQKMGERGRNFVRTKFDEELVITQYREILGKVFH